MKILIVEDEAVLARGLQFNFEQEGHDVITAADGPTALHHLRSDEEAVDLVVLDLMLPGMSGYETCRAIRDMDVDLPILVLSARTLSQDKAQAFDCGTDQYMTKPFALPELLSRVRNLLERRNRGSVQIGLRPAVHSVQFGHVRVDFDTHRVSAAGRTHELTRMELQLLRYFIEHEGVVLSRSQILEEVWEETAAITTRSIDNFVMRLRRMIEENPAKPRHIRSIRGTGYRFVADS